MILIDSVWSGELSNLSSRPTRLSISHYTILERMIVEGGLLIDRLRDVSERSFFFDALLSFHPCITE